MENKKIQKFISSILITVIMAQSIFLSMPEKVSAVIGVGDINIESGSVIVDTVSSAIYRADDTVTKKVGVTAEVATSTTTVKTWYEKILEQVLMAIARRALQEITKSTVTWINGGFHGSPLFLENPKSFFEDIVKSEVKAVVDIYGYDSIRFPFGKDFAINTINAYKNTLENNVAYSLSKVMTDPVQLYNYQNNFNVGGWNAFLVNTQYPQNNYLGFQMMASEQLAGKITSSPGVNNAINKVKETLQQGQGFLSPQTCPSNTSYNNGTNEWQRSSFNMAEQQKWYTEQRKVIENADGMTEQEKKEQIALLDKDFKEKTDMEKANWAEENTCPGGLVSTTPGSVVSNQIMTALDIPANSTLQAMGLGNSLSAIFDALLNKFLSPDGLLGLASSKNTKPAEDGWSYNGLTLGSPEDGNNSSWDAGPDEEIILDKFKKELSGKTIVTTVKADETEEVTEEIGNTNTKEITRGTYIPGDIANTEIEIILLSELSSKIDNKNPLNPGVIQLAKILDQCVPGPDKGWETRLNNERDLMNARFGRKKGQGDDLLKARAGDEGMKELKFAVNTFKSWLITKIIGEIPGAGYYTDALKAMDDFPQQLKEAIDSKQKKSQALSRLKAFEKSLATIPKQPVSTDPDFKIQEGKLIAIRKQYNSIRSSISSSVTIENARAVLDSANDQIRNLQELNTQCKTERVAAGWDAVGGEKSKQNGITELEKFCSIPIVSGYSHGTVIRNDEAVRWNNCKNHNTDYCNSEEWKNPEAFAGWFTFRNPNYNPSLNPVTLGESFIPQPSDSGLSGFEDLPMVNAKEVFGDNGGGVDRVNIDMDCSVIFRANPLDYTSAGDISI
jgi:hypothetical protein